MKYLILFLLSFNAHAGLVECGGIEDGPAIQSSLDLGGRTELKGVCATTSQIIIRQPDGLGNQQGDTVLDGGVIRGPGIMIDGAATSHAVSMYVNGATTATDYYRQSLNAYGTVIDAAINNDGYILRVSAGDTTLAIIDLHLAPGLYPYAKSSIVSDDAAAQINQFYSWAKTAAITTTIDKITFTSSVTDGMGIGTTFKIYRGGV